MNISKKIIACAAVCAALGIGVTAYASQPGTEENVIPQTTAPVVESAVTVEESAPADDKFDPIDEKAAPSEEAESKSSHLNVPSKGDKVLNDTYFIHTFSDGVPTYIPFIRGTELDIDVLKKLGSDTPFKDEICYIVIEFLDGTKRYFKLGDSPNEFLNIDMLQYGICTYLENGTGEYYEEFLSDGMKLNGWG